MKNASVFRRLFSFLGLSLLLLFATACKEEDAAALSAAEYPDIDPLFREFYGHLGGMDVLGPAISPLFSSGSANYQYTSASLMVYDPTAPASHRFQLAPLGKELGIEEPAVPQPENQDLRWVDGHIIYEDFVPFYEKIGGARYMGPPISEVHINPDTRRYEQYFANLGLYRLENEPSGVVHTLEYGAWKCQSNCRTLPASNASIEIHPAVGQQFSAKVSQLGQNFTGFTLTEPYETPGGEKVQVFENVVLAVQPSDPGRVFLLPITEKLGILADPPVDSDGSPGMYFYPVDSGKGYRIPQNFLDYLSMHGGLDTSGPPVGELASQNDHVFRQCFTNLCLEEHRNSSGSGYILPAPLGYTFRNIALQSTQTPKRTENTASYPGSDGQPAVPVDATPSEIPAAVDGAPSTPQFQQIAIQVWEALPMVSSQESQEIKVQILKDGAPMESIEPDLVLNLPDGGIRQYYLYPTGADGQTSARVDPVQAPDGTLISYRVCIQTLDKEKYCVRDSFLIWEAR